MVTLGRMSWMRSVSRVTMWVSMPCSAASTLRVPRTSSASKPGALKTGMLKASIISRQRVMVWPMSQATCTGSKARSSSTIVSWSTPSFSAVSKKAVLIWSRDSAAATAAAMSARTLLVEVGDGGERLRDLGLEVLEAGGLVGGVADVAEGGAGEVHGDGEVGRLEVVDDAEQGVGEAEDAGGVLAGAAGDEGVVLEGVVGAMDDAVAIEKGEANRAVVGGSHVAIIRRFGAFSGAIRCESERRKGGLYVRELIASRIAKLVPPQCASRNRAGGVLRSRKE